MTCCSVGSLFTRVRRRLQPVENVGVDLIGATKAANAITLKDNRG
jgi:hypothetical protein